MAGGLNCSNYQSLLFLLLWKQPVYVYTFRYWSTSKVVKQSLVSCNSLHVDR